MKKKYKLLPLTIMLIAGAITGLSTFLLHYKSTTALWITVGVLILFFIIGTILQKVIIKFELEIAAEEAKKAEEEAKKAEEEGKVVEKEGAAEEEGEDSADRVTEKNSANDVEG